MKATNANVSNASAPSSPPIIGPKEGLDEATLDIPPAAMEEGSGDETTCVEEKTCVDERMSVEEGSGDSVTAKKSR